MLIASSGADERQRACIPRWASRTPKRAGTAVSTEINYVQSRPPSLPHSTFIDLVLRRTSVVQPGPLLDAAPGSVTPVPLTC
jgi:hypothetical protein